MIPFSLRLFGAPAIERAESTCTQFRSRRALALLGYLVVHGCTAGPTNGRAAARSELADLIWPDCEPERGRSNLRWALSYLGNLLPTALERTRHTVQFNLPPACRCDLLELGAALESGDLEQLATAVGLYRGDFLQGAFADESAEFETWLVTQRETWRLRVLRALEQLARQLTERGDYARALLFVDQWLTIEPWAEEAYRRSMWLLARLGRGEAALERFERCRRVLADELGVEPTPATRQLFHRLQQASHEPPHNLPAQPTPFVGRRQELQTAHDLLRDDHVRLLTLIGPGGMGKSRLALEIGRCALERFADGVYWIPLEDACSAAAICTAVGSAVAGPSDDAVSAADDVEQLAHLLARREVLLILDQLEATDAAASILPELLQRAAGVKVLATGRERLNLRWERALDIGGLKPEAAEELFCLSAERYRPGCRPSADERACIAEIVALVGGMPLALELAAAWIRVQPCRAIADALRENIDLLTTADRDRPDRQRSVRAAFESSWRLLTAEERATLGRLSVFPGSFSSQAAQTIAGAGWRQLAHLADRALLQHQMVASEQGTQVYYTLHPLLRAYAAEKHAPAAQLAASFRPLVGAEALLPLDNGR